MWDDATTAAAKISMATAAIVADVNGTTENTSRASALCTAKPTAGASGKASRPGTRRRVSANPRQVQNSVATAAQRTAPEIVAIAESSAVARMDRDRDYSVSTESARPSTAPADHACASAVTRASEVDAPLPSPFSKSPSTQPSWFETWARQITGRRHAAANA
jgi:hypothetical protein